MTHAKLARNVNRKILLAITASVFAWTNVPAQTSAPVLTVGGGIRVTQNDVLIALQTLTADEQELAKADGALRGIIRAIAGARTLQEDYLSAASGDAERAERLAILDSVALTAKRRFIMRLETERAAAKQATRTHAPFTNTERQRARERWMLDNDRYITEATVTMVIVGIDSTKKGARWALETLENARAALANGDETLRAQAETWGGKYIHSQTLPVEKLDPQVTAAIERLKVSDKVTQPFVGRNGYVYIARVDKYTQRKKKPFEEVEKEIIYAMRAVETDQTDSKPAEKEIWDETGFQTLKTRLAERK